jgi:hypothetical protein
MRAIAFVALLLASCGGGGGSDRPVSDPPPMPTPPSSNSAEKPGLDVTAPANPDEVVARALRTVSEIRGLPIKGKVDGKYIGRDEMVRRVKEQIHRDIPEKVLVAQDEILFSLGTVSADFDYETSILGLMGTQLAGFYDPKEKAMYMAQDLVGIERDATLAHELVHALQDQHYDLEKLISFKEDAGDEQTAIHALAEGDATSAMFDHVMAARGGRATDLGDEMLALQIRGSMEISPETQNVPTIVKRSVISPYVDGTMFVHWARRRDGWRAVDEAWKNPPKTTEQLLHPEKYAAREPGVAIAVPLPDPQGPKDVIFKDIFGEQSLRLLFEEWMPRRRAVESASDWGGDRIAVFRDDKRFAVAWHVQFDTEAAAVRGLEAFARGVLRDKVDVSAEEGAKAAKKGKLCRERKDAGPYAALRTGKHIAIVAGPYDRPSPTTARSAGTCANALKWAKSIADQR